MIIESEKKDLYFYCDERRQVNKRNIEVDVIYQRVSLESFDKKKSYIPFPLLQLSHILKKKKLWHRMLFQFNIKV